jgi:hypothetical protein
VRRVCECLRPATNLASIGLSSIGQPLKAAFFFMHNLAMNPTFAERIKERRETDRLVSHLRYDDFRRLG